MDLRLDAERYVISLKPDGMMNLAAALTNPTINANINPQELRLVLRMRAQKNPEEILYRAPDETASVKVAAIHALDLGIIAFVPENESYYYGLEETPMCRIPVGNNPFEYLCSFLTGPDGQEEFERIKRDLSFWF